MPPHITANVEIFQKAERIAGCSANNGIWIWENAIVVGFIVGYHKEQESLTIDRAQPAPRMQARSLDGGHSWAIESTSRIMAA